MTVSGKGGVEIMGEEVGFLDFLSLSEFELWQKKEGDLGINSNNRNPNFPFRTLIQMAILTSPLSFGRVYDYCLM